MSLTLQAMLLTLLGLPLYTAITFLPSMERYGKECSAGNAK